MSRGTQSIGSLIKWDHSQDWFVPLYPHCFNMADKAEHKFVIDLNKIEHKFYSGHSIGGRVIFPTSGYIVLVWEVLAVINNKNMNDLAIEFTDIKIKHATIMETKTTLFVRVQPDGEFSVRNKNDVAVTGKYCLVNDNCWHSHLLENSIEHDNLTLDQKECYKEFRIRGFDYGPDFRGD